MKAFLNLAEKLFTIFTLLIASGAVLVLLLSPNSDSAAADGSPLIQLIWFCIYAITFCLLAVQWRGFTRIPKNLDIAILLLVCIAVFSYFWADVPQLTLRRGIALVGSTSFGVYFATRYNPQEQFKLLAWTFGIAVALSVVFALFLPSYGLDTYPFQGAWRGVYSQKNILGRYMVISSIIFLLLALNERRNRWILWTIFSISIALILLSTSKTSLVVLLALLLLVPIYKTIHLGYTWFLPIATISILFVACFAILLTGEADSILSFLGKDATLTGRTPLWLSVLEMIQQRPWLGYGYTSFWLGMEGASAYVWREIGWAATHAHNGLLEVWLDLGLVGLLVFLYTYVKSIIKAITFVRYGQSWNDLWPILFLTFMFLLNITQSAIMDRNNIIWIIYVSINLHRANQYSFLTQNSMFFSARNSKKQIKHS